MASEVLGVRERIIASLFKPPSDNTYRSHVKIWEDDEATGGRKPRHIVLAYHAPTNKGKILKTKVNTIGTYSVGKTWELDALRGFESHDARHFHITLSRTYKWESESPREQVHFLSHAVQLFRETNPGVPLNLVGNIPEIPQTQVTLPARARSPSRPPDTARPAVTNSSPQALRTVPRVNHQRMISSGSGGGFPTALNGSDGAQRTNGFQTPQMSASPVQSNYSFQSPPSIPSSTSRPVRQRPSGAMDNVPGISSSPSHSGTGRHSPIDRSREPGFIDSSSSNSLQSPPLSQRFGLVNRGATISSSSVTPSRRDSPSRSRINGIPERPSNEFDRSSQRGRPSQERPSFDGRAESQSTSSASRSQAPQQLSHLRQESKDPERSSTPSSSAAVPGRDALAPSPTQPPDSLSSSQSDRHRHPPPAESPTFQKAEQALASELAAADRDNVDEDDLEATLANVEDILEGYEWISGDLTSRKGQKGAADQIEARLLSELSALEKANTHSFIESDDRVAALLNFLDSAVTELDQMDILMSSYKVHLNIVGDDISHIQSQGKGLQVQSQNQRLLLDELQQILQTGNVDPDALRTLAQENMNTPAGVQRLEAAAAELYKALQASRDKGQRLTTLAKEYSSFNSQDLTDMAASMERLQEYRRNNSQFCKRTFDVMQLMMMEQSRILSVQNTSPLTLPSHQGLESALGLYSGLILYLKEMDEDRYSKLCASYFRTASELHCKEMKTLLLNYAGLVKKSVEEDAGSFSQSAVVPSKGAGPLQRSKTLGRRGKDKDGDGDNRSPEAFTQAITQIGRAIYREEEFMADFLQINDVNLTFADYASMESYFRRQASQTFGLGPSTMKLVRGAMDLIFGFLPEELKQWVDAALQRDNIQIVGMLASIERYMSEVDERQNAFFLRMLDKQHLRMKNRFDRHVQEQIKAIEKTKLTAKKREGVAHFIRFFPTYVQRVEAQLMGVTNLEIRESVDTGLERIVDAMFDTLQQMARIEGDQEEKEKGQLNYHVILIENMHCFLQDMSRIQTSPVSSFSRRAETIYKENLSAYVKIVLRRPFARIMDYFDGVERLLQNTAPTEISNNNSYSRSSLKRILKDYSSKDTKRHVDALYKRVEKHFSADEEPGTASQSDGVLPSVWSACEEETVLATQKFEELINQCYGSLGVSLEFSVSDIKSAFKRRS